MDARKLEVFRAGAGAMDDARPLVQRDLVPGDHAMLDPGPGRKIVERPSYCQPTSSEPFSTSSSSRPGTAAPHPLTVQTTSVVGLGIDRGGDVRRERPGRRRPDDERFARPVEKR